MQLTLNLNLPEQPKVIKKPKQRGNRRLLQAYKSALIQKQLCQDFITGKRLEHPELHHIVPIKDGGAEFDKNNMIVVEANLHRVIHHLMDRTDIAKLYPENSNFRILQVDIDDIKKARNFLISRNLMPTDEFWLTNTIEYFRLNGSLNN